MPALNEVLLVPEDAVPSGRGRDGTEGESRITWHERECDSAGERGNGMRHEGVRTAMTADPATRNPLKH